MVEERCVQDEAILRRVVDGTQDSESTVRICAAENLRFPGEGSSAQGKSGPKARPKGVVDGKQVKDSCTTEMY